MIGTNLNSLFSSSMASPNVWLAGIYCRLSKDDDNQGESASISNQRELLTSVCKAQGWKIVEIYQDDGFTGLNMDRPGLKKLLEDVKARKINLVITKDLSRLGRNYLEVGQLIETFFPVNRTRYIAFNDNIDTASESNEILPFKNVLNEMYSKDISKKVHASYIVAAHKGSYTGTVPPFGYLKDPKQKGHLIVDSETAPYAKQIFRMALEGHGPNFICHWLEKNQVPCPAWWNRQRGFRNKMTKWEILDPESGRFVWDFSVLKDMLINPIYMGAVASQKRYHVFKAGDIGDKKPDEWVTVEDCHEPLVSKTDFMLIQEKIKSRTHPRSNGTFSLFSGLLKCGECGKALLYRETNSKARTPVYTCKTYMSYGKQHCTQHRVEEAELKEKVLETIRAAARAVTIKPEDVQEKLKKSRSKKAEQQRDSLTAFLAKDEDRLELLGRMMSQLYEDRMAGVITEDNFNKLREKTQAEQKEIEERVAQIKNQLNGTPKENPQSSQWAELIGQYTDLKELDPETLNRLVKKIVVHEKIDDANVRHLSIEIFFNFNAIPNIDEYQPDEQRPYRLAADDRPVINTDTGETFANIAEACAKYHTTRHKCRIKEVCDGKRRTSLGQHWAYAG